MKGSGVDEWPCIKLGMGVQVHTGTGQYTLGCPSNFFFGTKVRGRGGGGGESQANSSGIRI